MIDELVLHYKDKILSPAEVRKLSEGTYVREHRRNRYGEHCWMDGRVWETNSGTKVLSVRGESHPIKSRKGRFYTLTPDGFGAD